MGETLYAIGSMLTEHSLSKLRYVDMEWFGLTKADLAVVFVSVLLMLAVSLKQRKRPVREQVAALPFAGQAVLWSMLFVAVLIFGTYGIGYDSSQFIYNRF